MKNILIGLGIAGIVIGGSFAQGYNSASVLVDPVPVQRQKTKLPETQEIQKVAPVLVQQPYSEEIQYQQEVALREQHAQVAEQRSQRLQILQKRQVEMYACKNKYIESLKEVNKLRATTDGTGIMGEFVDGIADNKDQYAQNMLNICIRSIQ